MQANLTPEKIELMDRYLDHELSDEEADAFEQELAERPGLLGELREYSRFRSNLDYITAQRDFSEIEQVLAKRKRPKSTILKMLRVITWLLVVLTVFIGYLVFTRYRLFEILLHSFKE